MFKNQLITMDSPEFTMDSPLKIGHVQGFLSLPWCCWTFFVQCCPRLRACHPTSSATQKRKGFYELQQPNHLCATQGLQQMCTYILYILYYIIYIIYILYILYYIYYIYYILYILYIFYIIYIILYIYTPKIQFLG